MVWLRDASMDEDQASLQHGHLFQELKKRFPEVPDNVVTSLMRQHGFIREKCIEALGHESNNYLYGPEGDHTNVVISHINNLHLSGAITRQRSDSGGNAVQMRQRSDSVESRGSVGSNSSNTSAGKTVANSGASSAPATPNREHQVIVTTSQFSRSSSAVESSAGQAISNSYSGQKWSSNAQLPASQPGYHIQQTGSPTYPHGAYSPAGKGIPYPVMPQTARYTMQVPWPYDPVPNPPTRPGPFIQGFSNVAVYPQTSSSNQPHGYPLHQFGKASTPSPNSGSSFANLSYRRVSDASGNGPGLQGTTEVSPGNPPAGYWYVAGQSTPSTSDLAYQGYLGQNHPVVHSQQAGSGPSTPTRPMTTSPPSFPTPVWQHMASQHSTSHHVPSDQGHLQHPLHPLIESQICGDGRRMSEDSAYTQALLLHQKERKRKLEEDLEKVCRTLEPLRLEVAAMERDWQERQYKRSTTFPSAEDVQKLREENRRLIIDIQLMTRELDMFNNGQTPLGVLDPLEQQSFYGNIGSTGQRGSVHGGGGDVGDRNQPSYQSSSSSSGSALPTSAPVSSTSQGGSEPPVLPRRPMAPLAQADPEPDPESDEEENWSCPACTFLNHPALDACEFCEMSRVPVAGYR